MQSLLALESGKVAPIAAAAAQDSVTCILASTPTTIAISTG